MEAERRVGYCLGPDGGIKVPDSGQELGEKRMPSMKLTVQFSFATGQQIVTSVEAPAASPESLQVPVAPYRVDGATAPEEPTLISSSSFVQVG
jgi:hypothetical protein